MNTMTMCPDIAELRAYATDRLAGSERDVLRGHLEVCPRCRGVIEGLEATHRAPSPPGEGGVWTETAMDGTVTTDRAGLPGGVVLGDGTTQQGGVEGDADVLDLSFLDPPQHPDGIGRIADYDVLGLLGRGGMGVVLRAFDPSLQRVVAIKVLAPKLASSRRAHKRFLHEARSAAAINHPNVVTIHAVSVHRGVPYLVMECIPGQSLRERIRNGTRMTPSEVLRIGLQIASGLAAAHAHGVIHRDIKPANIMLEGQVERVKITDFGLALAALNLSEMTSLEEIVGTPAYMSPEQVRGEVLDARSDLFSLGCVMYAMVARHSPFQGSHALDIIRKVTDVTPPPLHEIDPKVPRELSDLTARLLSKNPANRLGTAADVAEAIRRQLAAANQEPLVLKEATATVPLAQLRWKRRRKLMIDVVSIVGALVLTVGILVAAIVLLRPTPRPAVPPFPNDPLLGGRAPVPGVPGRNAPVPPALPARVLTVGPSREADFPSISQALALVTPNSVIRLEGRTTHQGAIRIDDSENHRGLRIEGAPGTVLTAPGSRNAVIFIEDVPDVTLRGVEIQTGEVQFGLQVKGAVPGLEVVDVHFRKPPRPSTPESWSHVWLAYSAHGTARAPIRFRDVAFENWPIGLVLQGTYGQVAHVVVEGCRFLGVYERPLELIAPVEDIHITGCLFTKSRNGVYLDNLGSSGDAGRISVANNSFDRVAHWVNPTGSAGDVPEVRLINNAILDVDAIDVDGDRLAALKAEGWQIEGNLWQHADAPESSVARAIPDLGLRSRDPSNPGYLRPGPRSPLVDGGVGDPWPGYVGAFPPETP